MRDNIVCAIANFVLKFASKQYQDELSRVYAQGLKVDKEEALYRAELMGYTLEDF